MLSVLVVWRQTVVFGERDRGWLVGLWLALQIRRQLRTDSSERSSQLRPCLYHEERLLGLERLFNSKTMIET